MRQQQYGQIFDQKYNKMCGSGNTSFSHTLKRSDFPSIVSSSGKSTNFSKYGKLNKTKKTHDKLSKTMGAKETAQMTVGSLMSRNAVGGAKYDYHPSYQLGSSLYKPKSVTTTDHSVERAKKMIL